MEDVGDDLPDYVREMMGLPPKGSSGAGAVPAPAPAASGGGGGDRPGGDIPDYAQAMFPDGGMDSMGFEDDFGAPPEDDWRLEEDGLLDPDDPDAAEQVENLRKLHGPKPEDEEERRLAEQRVLSGGIKLRLGDSSGTDNI